jgi:outer membrane lipoprotein-sorting protein
MRGGKLRTMWPFVLAVFPILCGVPLLWGQAAPAGERDPQAISILARSHAAMGGSAAAAISDIHISGRTLVQRPQGDEVSGTVTFDFAAPDKSRVVIDAGGEVSTHVVNGKSAVATAKGRSRRLPLQTMIHKRPEELPVLSEVSNWNDPSFHVSYVGLESLDGRPVHHVKVQQPPRGTTRIHQDLSNLSAVDLYIDSESYLLLKRSRVVPGIQDYRQTLQVEETYADYRPAGKLLVPYSISFYIRGQKIMTVTIDSVAINSGLNAAEFEVQ